MHCNRILRNKVKPTLYTLILDNTPLFSRVCATKSRNSISSSDIFTSVYLKLLATLNKQLTYDILYEKSTSQTVQSSHSKLHISL